MKRTVQEIDHRVFHELLKLRNAGRTSVRAGEIARKISTDSVMALGAMLRVQRMVNSPNPQRSGARLALAAALS